MSPESENFDALRRLLALKRHEQPPPGYFDDLSRRISARLEAGAAGAIRESADGTWWQRIWAALEVKPMFAGAFGASVCALLISGILNAENTGPAAMAVNPLAGQSVASSDEDGAVVAPRVAEFPVVNTSSNSVASLFDHFQLQSRPASFTIPGGN